MEPCQHVHNSNSESGIYTESSGTQTLDHMPPGMHYGHHHTPSLVAKDVER